MNNMNFEFKSNLTAPQHELLSPFETDLHDMTESINFKPVRNDFQKNLVNYLKHLLILQEASSK